MLVSALLRRVAAAGGTGAVLRRGEEQAGALLIQCADRGQEGALLQRVLDPAGRYRWQATGPAENRADYLLRRIRIDPDLWLVELDHPQAADLAAEVAG